MLGSLKNRLALSNLAISLAALIVLTLAFGYFLRQQTIDSNKGFVLQEARLVQHRFRTFVRQAESGRSPTVRAFYREFIQVGTFFDKRIVFYDATGLCRFDSKGKYTDTTHGCGGSEAWKIAPGNSTVQVSGLISHGSRSFYVVQMPVGYKATVVLVADGSAIIPSLGLLAPGLLLALLAATVIWVVMAGFFAYSVSRPLAQVTEAARGIATGDYSKTVDIRSKGEIGELASSFNHMVTQVRLANQVLKDFVANVSHDLRTPITVISGFAGSLLDRTMESRDDVDEAAGIIAAEATRMEHLVDDLLQLTRLESGLRRFNPEPVSVPDLVSRTILRVQTVVPNRWIDNATSDDLPLAWADEELIERVLINLLNNALAYTPEDGSIRVSAVVELGWLRIEVADSGSGIMPADQPRIFERFYRADKGRTGGEGHSGLGLPIVKEIVEAHGGSVMVASEVGRGAVFAFTVPILPDTGSLRQTGG